MIKYSMGSFYYRDFEMLKFEWNTCTHETMFITSLSQYILQVYPITNYPLSEISQLHGTAIAIVPQMTFLEMRPTQE